MKIAIHQNKKIYYHSGTWNNEWIVYCQNNQLDYEIIDCYGLDAIEKFKNIDILLWHFGNYSLQDMQFARTILNTAKSMGVKVFPDFNTAWHFDDKIAEYYLLKAVGAPIPESWVFYSKEEAVDWLKKKAKYPLVGKLRTGSGSNNVKLFKSKHVAVSYARRMFGKGFRNVPGILFKTMSNVRSSHNWETFMKRLIRIPDFIQTYTRSKKLPTEHGYVYFQEFIPNDGFDLKVVVVGDKLSFLARDVRKGDFRASGGGEINYNKFLITEDIRNTAFKLSKELGFQCMGYDFVIDKRDNVGKIVEISYGFSHTAQLELGGYWDRNGNWHNEPLNAPEELLKNILA